MVTALKSVMNVGMLIPSHSRGLIQAVPLFYCK
jgi:hypothetical protein